MAFVEKGLIFIAQDLSPYICDLPKHKWAEMDTCQYQVAFLTFMLPIMGFFFFIAFTMILNQRIDDAIQSKDDSFFTRVIWHFLRRHQHMEDCPHADDECGCQCVCNTSPKEC